MDYITGCVSLVLHWLSTNTQLIDSFLSYNFSLSSFQWSLIAGFEFYSLQIYAKINTSERAREKEVIDSIWAALNPPPKKTRIFLYFNENKNDSN